MITDSAEPVAGAAEAIIPPSPTRTFDTGGLSLRSFTARGVLINAAFDGGLSVLALLQGFVLAALLTRADYGVWGVLVVSLGVLARLKLVGISDKYVQQDEPDQESAFQKAFTLEVLVTAAAMVPLLAALPVIAVIYGHWSLVAPGLVLLTVLAANALQAPFWIYYRQMNFVRQRSLAVIEPLVAFAVAVGLAVAGAGYWALALGVVAGAWSGAIAALISSPYRLAWRYDRGALRVYAGFSGPILVATVCSIVLANTTVIAANAHLGLAGVGAIALAATITAFTTKLDDLISGTLYPAICAMQNRLDLLRESFVKSNRMALMWAMPFGIGLALFAPDLVRFGIGHKWHAAIVLLQITGVVAALGHLGFNWDDYFRARGQTRPLAVAMVCTTVVQLGVGLPLLFTDGLTGVAIGIGAGAVVALLFRAWYLSRLFEGFGFARHALRAVLPTVPAAFAVLAVRWVFGSPGTLGGAVAEVALYALVVAACTWWVEGALVREAVGYVALRRASGGPGVDHAPLVQHAPGEVGPGAR